MLSYKCVLLCCFEEIQSEEMATSAAGHVGSSHSRLASMMLHMDAWFGCCCCLAGMMGWILLPMPILTDRLVATSRQQIMYRESPNLCWLLHEHNLRSTLCTGVSARVIFLRNFHALELGSCLQL